VLGYLIMYFFLSFLSGIALFYTFQYFPFLTSTVVLLACLYLFLKRKFFCIAIILLGIGFAFIRYEPHKEMAHISNKEVEVKGIFLSLPIETESGRFRQFFEIKAAMDLKDGERVDELAGREIILFSESEREPEREYELTIKFLRDRTRLNPGRRHTDMLSAKIIEVVDSGNLRTSLYARLQEQRHRLDRFISEHFEKDSAAFIASITTGQRALMDESLRNAFSVTGLAHILSISGTHFGLFSVLLFGIFRLLIAGLPYRILQRITIYLTPSQASALLSFPFMLAYLGLSGGSIPAVRAFIMISLFLIGLLIARKGFWLNSLLFAAFVLTVWNPSVILDLSFQLSFLAVLFIGFAINTIEGDEKQEMKLLEESESPSRLKKVSNYFKNALLLTLSASIGTAPLVAYHFHYFSVISPLSNLLIAPLIGFILIPLSVASSFLFLITGHYMFTPIVSTISDVSISLVKLLSDIPFADIKIPPFPPIIVLLFYAGFIFYFLSGMPKNADRNKKPNNLNEMPKQAWPEEIPKQVRNDTFRVRHDGTVSKGLKIVTLNHALNLIQESFQNLCRHFGGRKRYTLLIPFVPVLIYFSLTIFEKKDLTITFLDVGQGDSSVVELPDGKTLVIDTGRTGRETAGFLTYRGKRTIDALAISHIHPDHTGGLDHLLRKFRVKELWDNGRLIIPEDFSSTVKVRSLTRGDVVEGKGYRIYTLHPYSEFYSVFGSEYVGANNESLVLKIEGKNRSFLFAGDVEEEAEDDMSHLGRWLKSDILKVPHHGGKTSAHEPFLELISPQFAVVSVGRDNRFGHPHREILDMLGEAKIFRTDNDGAIKIKESDKGLEIKIYKDIQLEKTKSIRREVENIKRLFVRW